MISVGYLDFFFLKIYPILTFLILFENFTYLKKDTYHVKSNVQMLSAMVDLPVQFKYSVDIFVITVTCVHHSKIDYLNK